MKDEKNQRLSDHRMYLPVSYNGHGM